MEETSERKKGPSMMEHCMGSRNYGGSLLLGDDICFKGEHSLVCFHSNPCKSNYNRDE